MVVGVTLETAVLTLKRTLLTWINGVLPNQNITNFNTHWKDGRMLSALINYCHPGLIQDHTSLKASNAAQNVQKAIAIAKSQLGVESFMATEEFTLEKPDEISMMMYLAQFSTPGQRILLLWIQQQIPDEKVTNFSDSWVSGKALGALTNAISGGRFPGYAEMTSDNALANIEQAMVAAEKMLGVRRTITPAMFSEVQIDELFRLSYLAQFQSAKESRDSLTTVVAAAGKVEVSDLQIPDAIGEGKSVSTELDCSDAGYGEVKAEVVGRKENIVTTTVKEVEDDGQLGLGKYRVSFVPPCVDVYDFSIRYGGEHVIGSPFSVNLYPPDPEKVQHTGTRDNSDTRQAVALNFKTKEAGRGKLSAKAEGEISGNLPIKITPLGDGTFAVNFHPQFPDIYTVNVFWGKFSARAVGETSGPVALQVNRDKKSNYCVCFKPPNPDKYRVDVSWDGKPVPGSPFTVDLRPPPMPEKVECAVPIYNDPGKIAVLLVDASNAGKGRIKASCTGERVGDVPTDLSKVAGRTYQVTFTPPQNDLYTLDVLFDNKHVKGSPFKIDMRPGIEREYREICVTPMLETPPDVTKHIPHDAPKPGRVDYTKGPFVDKYGQPSRPDKCTVRDQPEYVYVNCPIHFVVDAKEAGSGELCVKASVLRSEQDVSRPELKVENNKDGTFDVDYVPNAIGKHSFNILWSGQVIPNSPVNVDVRDEEPAVEGPAKEEIQVVFVPDKSIDYIIDLSGVPSGNLSAKCRGEESGQVSVTCEPINLDSKKYRVTFVPPRPDLYHLSVFFNGKEMKGSPREIDLRKKLEDLEPTVEGPAREEIQPVFVPDKPIDHIVCFSSFPSGTLSAKCRGKESGPVPVTYEPISPDSKKYRFAFVPSQPDLYHLSLFFNDKEVKGSPYEIDLRRKVKKSIDSAPIPTVYTAPEDHQFIPDDKEGTPTAPKTQLFWSGKPVPKSFPEEAVRRFPHGQPIEYDLAVDAKAGDIEARVIHKDTNSRLKVKISKVSKGKYHLSFSPKKPGLYAFHILVKKKDIKQSPIYFLYEGPPNPEACLVKDIPEEWYIHEQGSFTVDATEAGTASLSVKVTPPERGKGGDIKVINNGNGTYTVEHTPEVLDSHTIALTWAGKAIPNSPVTTSVKKRVPTAKAGLGPYTNIVPVGDRVEVDVVNLDKYASDRKYVTASARAKVGTDQPEIEYKEGMCAVSFVPTVADDYSLSVKISDEEIDGSSFSIKSVDRRCLSKDYAPTEDICSSDVEAGRDVCLVIPKDDSLPHGSEPQVEVRGPEGPCEMKLIDQVESSYGLNFTPSVPGDYLIHVRKDKDSEAEIESSPYKIRAVKKEPDAHKVIIPDSFHSLFVDPVPLGSSLKFNINTANASSGTLKTQQSGEGKASIDVTQKNENVYTCSVAPTERGRCQIDIQWNNESICGSPFHLMFVPATGINLEGETFMVGTQNRFTVDRRSVLEGHLEIHCSDLEAADISIMPAKDGLEFYCITVKKEGNYQIIVKYNGYNIVGSPFNVHFMKPASANMDFSLKAEGAETSDVSATIQNSLTLEQLPVNLSDLFSGNYALEFVPTKGLEYLVTIKCRVKVKTEEKVVTGSPFALRYERIAGDASKCRAEGQGLTKAIAGEWSSFFVYTEGVGSGELSVDIAGDVFGDEEAIVSAISPTEFEVQYILRQKGSYQISVTWDGQDIPGSAFQITCSAPEPDTNFSEAVFPTNVTFGEPIAFILTPSSSTVDINDIAVQARSKSKVIGLIPGTVTPAQPPKPENVQALGPGLQDGFVGQEGSFTIETEEAGYGTMSLNVKGPKGGFKINLDRHPANDRTILASYSPQHAGVYVISIKWAGVEIPGSPFQVNIREEGRKAHH